MNDSDLKNLLLETCPVRPGQEQRAWSALRDRLHPRPAGLRAWLFVPTWRGASVALTALALFAVVGNFVFLRNAAISLVTTTSQEPGIYATAFYSHSAQAQVVWLNGMEPATDKLTYQDPTTVIAATTDTPPPAHDPNSL